MPACRSRRLRCLPPWAQPSQRPPPTTEAGNGLAKSQSRYVCQSCSEAFLRWEGQCRNCGTWNSLVETLVRDASRPRAHGAGAVSPGPGGGRPVSLADVLELDIPRLTTGLNEFDRVLGGGLVPGSLALVGGEPGIGKSTLLLPGAAGL